MLLVEIGGLFEGGCDPEQQTFLKVIRHHLQADWQPHGIESIWDGGAWKRAARADPAIGGSHSDQTEPAGWSTDGHARVCAQPNKVWRG
jgi:hypothetical protein